MSKKKNKRKHAALELPLVADGVVQHDHLKQINQNEQWLKDELAKKEAIMISIKSLTAALIKKHFILI
ncbi:hypothetical protein BsIDN1_47960 [Bacillus safensis]|uniref:YetF C-terminal domain-containing protein n=1 Tax=Bacillus safensis TaxID=561879 RepID=A0A5S9MDW2_BACIA|nr:hypothetical protein BsIDN1_47960 [Bacillus safensis]